MELTKEEIMISIQCLQSRLGDNNGFTFEEITYIAGAIFKLKHQLKYLEDKEIK